jgi:exosortase
MESANLVSIGRETAPGVDAMGGRFGPPQEVHAIVATSKMSFRTDVAPLAAAAILLPSLVTLLYWSITRDMAVDWWEDPNYSHGLIVPMFSGYLVWQERERLRALPLCGSWLGLPVLVAGLALLLLGVAGTELFLMRSSLIVVIAGLVLLHAGTAVFRQLLFPLAFLLFMIPLPSIVFNAIAFPLQGLAATNATAALDFLGVPVLRDGNVIHLSRVTLGVAEACSGIRSLISLLALAVVWAHFAVPGLWAKLVFVAAAFPITILANAGRVVITGLVAQSFGSEYADGFFHGFSGWIIFLVAFVCLLGVQGLLRGVRRLTRRG